MQMPDLYHYPLSPCSEKVRYALSFKGISWNEVIIDLASKENLTATYLTLNPTGCIPTLVHNQDVVTESTAILEYIEAGWPEPSLTPEAPIERAQMRLWAKWVDEYLHPAWPGIAWTILIRPSWQVMGDDAVNKMLARLPDPDRRKRQLLLYKEGFGAAQARDAFTVFDETLARMDVALQESHWLCGDHMSLSDISVLPYLIATDAFGLLDDGFKINPTVKSWLDRLCTHETLRHVTRPQVNDERLRELRRVGQCALAAKYAYSN